jgi:NSS family neurotransmitter:Na+ symporter
MQPRNTGIILVAFGITAAVALFWNWPFKVSEIGGGPSVLMYLALLLVVGIPVVMVELALGSWSKTTFPKTLKMINSKLEFFGWFAAVNTFWLLIGIGAILSWAASFAYYSLTPLYPLSNWLNPLSGAFAFTNYFFNYAGPLFPLVGLAIIWGSIFLLLLSTKWGPRIRSIAIKIVFPALAIIMAITLALTLSLNGSIDPGINYYLGFNPQVLLNGSSWRTTITILFFNLGAGLGVLSFYTSRNPTQNKLTTASIIAPLLGTGLIFIAGLLYFTMSGATGLTNTFQSTTSLLPMGTLGYPAAPFIGWQAGFATITRNMGPTLGKNLAFLFYALILIAGTLGLSLIVEPIKETLQTKFNTSPRKLLAALAAAGFLASIPLTLTSESPWGYYLTTLSNWWVEGFGLTLVILVELIAVGWIWGADNAVGYINNNSRIKIPKGFKWIIKIVAPAIAIIALAVAAYDTIKGYVFNYWGYLTPLITSWQTLAPWYNDLNLVFLLLAAAWLATNIIIAALLTRRKPKEKEEEEKSEPRKEKRSKQKNA